ncbi:MAG: cupin domain-containing protein [Alphaproteobacteria bacterium]|nr:cupin domain-containing protein [Alphaproteobacteria bacterium]
MVDLLLREIRKICADGIRRGGEASAYLPRIIAAIDMGGTPTALEPRRLPATDRHLGTALAEARLAGAGDLAAAIDALADQLRWHDTYGFYGHDPSLEPFQGEYAFTAIMAPESRGRFGLLTSDRTFFGLSLQGPNIYYPPHAHTAVEVYYVIAGSAAWRRGDEAWTIRKPGTFILHDSGVAHAMRTANEPLLCLYSWVTDLVSPVDLVAEFA